MGHLAQTQTFPTYHKPIVSKDVFHTNKCYDHVITGLLVLREMIKVVFSESKETGYNSRSLLHKFRSSLDRREQLNSEENTTSRHEGSVEAAWPSG